MEIVVDDDANSARLTEANQKVTEYIEQTFDNVLAELQASPPGRAKIVLRHITSALPPSGPEIRITPWQVNNREIKYSWPGSSAMEAWRFACLIKILTQIHAAIVDGVVITKRDIFYHDPSLFKKQETVERYLNDIAFTCGVSRRDLNISASPKGLVCGFSGDHVELTPDISAIHQEKVDPINWILVIEKEATFNVLVEQNLHNSTRLGKGLLVTGKGYPDLNTRRFLRAVLDVAPLPISIFGIFDSDPDGFGIHRCYTSGSQKSSQEMAYNIPELKWIGVNLEDLMAHQSAMDACVPLTARDRGCAVAMLNRSFERGGSDVGIELFARRSLQQMLMLDKKAEMQALAEVPGGFTKWLTEKVQPQL